MVSPLGPFPGSKSHKAQALMVRCIETVVLVNHRHCGAYGKELQAEPEGERARHQEDLQTTAGKITAQYPHLKVETWFAEMKEETNSLAITFIKV